MLLLEPPDHDGAKLRCLDHKLSGVRPGYVADRIILRTVALTPRLIKVLREFPCVFTQSVRQHLERHPVVTLSGSPIPGGRQNHRCQDERGPIRSLMLEIVGDPLDIRVTKVTIDDRQALLHLATAGSMRSETSLSQ